MIQEEPCEVECGCSDVGADGAAAAWGPWGPCREGARSRTRQLLVPPKKPCTTTSRYLLNFRIIVKYAEYFPVTLYLCC